MEAMIQALVQQQAALTVSLGQLADQMRQHDGARTPGAIPHRKILDSRDFGGVEAFDGTEGKFAAWQHQFQCAIACSSARGQILLREAVTKTDEIGMPTEPEMQQLAMEVYHKLGLIVKGEPQIIIRSITDMNGFEAWRRLSRRYRPDTPVRRLQKLAEIISVTKAKNASELSTILEKWDMRIKVYEAEMEHQIDDHIKTAVLHGMCPADPQDVAVHALKKPDDYMVLREVMRTYVNNRAHEPSPMDVGAVDQDIYEEDAEYLGGLSSKLVCHNCGGAGHFARMCPSPPTSKGDKAKGKGKSGKSGTGKRYSWGNGEQGQKGQGKRSVKGFWGQGHLSHRDLR